MIAVGLLLAVFGLLIAFKEQIRSFIHPSPSSSSDLGFEVVSKNPSNTSKKGERKEKVKHHSHSQPHSKPKPSAEQNTQNTKAGGVEAVGTPLAGAGIPPKRTEMFPSTATENLDALARKVLEVLMKDDKLREEFFKTLLGIEDIGKYALDISQFEARKRVLERDIQLLKLLIQKQKLKREYSELLQPPPEVAVPKEIKRLKNEIVALKREIRELKSKLQSVKVTPEKGKEKKEGLKIELKPSSEELLKKFSGFFTSVVKIGETSYVFTADGNFYPVGAVLPDGTKIVSASLTFVEIEKQGVRVRLPLSAKTKTSQGQNLPF